MNLRTRFNARLPAANEFVRSFYRLESKPPPDVIIGMPSRAEIREAVEKRMPDRRVYSAIATTLAFTFSRSYNLVMRGLHLSGSDRFYVGSFAAWTMPDSGILPIMAHEITHWRQVGTLLALSKHEDGKYLARKAALCAHEGLAGLAEKEISRDEAGSFWDKAREYARKKVMIAFAICLAPFFIAPYFIDKLMSGLTKACSKESIGKLGILIDNHPVLARLVWPYRVGYNFADEVRQKAGGPAIAFRLICDYPPTTLREIFDPELYLLAHGKALEAVRAQMRM